MKKVGQLLKVFTLLLTYSFGMFNAVDNASTVNEIHVVQDEGQNQILKASSRALSPHAQQPQITFSDSTESITIDFKLSLSCFSLLSSNQELFFYSGFKQYNNYYTTLLIRHRKSNLIFPFHNFW
ncbi:hypothetical protein [Maribacter sp. MAR_2009_72]|uniref:hypothetical protein n=1 Tax=Maribacter sp. MAR_2009_72 TaxID=1250050 RepID=UPI0011A6834B|nr:hypothetical protein [Maribacter sp. MAR_2009_72]